MCVRAHTNRLECSFSEFKAHTFEAGTESFGRGEVVVRQLSWDVALTNAHPDDQEVPAVRRRRGDFLIRR